MRVIIPKDLPLRYYRLRALAIDESPKLFITCNSCGDRTKFCPSTMSRCEEIKI